MQVINGTHRWFVAQGFEILGNEQPTAAKWFDEDARNIIREYVDWPDQNEKGDDFFNNIMGSWHSYRPEDGLNTIGRNNGTAKSRFMFWYEEAVRNYKAGKKQAGLQDLGKAIHYLGDLCSPPHVGERSFEMFRGKKAFNPLRVARNGVTHLAYESVANALKRNYAIETGGLYAFATANSIEQIGHKTASYAVNYYAVIENSLIFPLTPEEAIAEILNGAEAETRAIKEPLERAQASTAGLLYRFYRDVR